MKKIKLISLSIILSMLAITSNITAKVAAPYTTAEFHMAANDIKGAMTYINNGINNKNLNDPEAMKCIDTAIAAINKAKAAYPTRVGYKSAQKEIMGNIIKALKMFKTHILTTKSGTNWKGMWGSKKWPDEMAKKMSFPDPNKIFKGGEKDLIRTSINDIINTAKKLEGYKKIKY